MIRFLPPGTLRHASAYACAIVLLIVLLAYWIWSITACRVDAQLTQLIASDSYTIFALDRDAGRENAIAEIQKTFGARPVQDRVELLVDEKYRTLAGNLPAWPSAVGQVTGWQTITIMREPGPSQARVLHRVLPDGAHLLSGYDLTDYFAGRKSFVVAFMGVSIPLVVTVFILGFLIRRSLLSQVSAISDAAQGILRGNLKERVIESGGNTELHLMSATVNRMLDHIETLVEGVTNVSNTIAHDLRTPLAEARARFEGLLKLVPEQDPKHTVIVAGIADIDRLIRTFNALLRLAQIESGARRSGFKPTDLSEVVAETVEFYQHAAEEKDIELSANTPSSLPVQCDPSLVAQAVGNVIDNAIRYTPAGGNIRIMMKAHEGSGAVIVVDDTGPGIPDHEKPKVIARFYRGVSNRHNSGSGLGLSLVAAIATLHNGALSFADNSPGLRVVLTLQAKVMAA